MKQFILMAAYWSLEETGTFKDSLISFSDLHDRK